MKRTMLFLWVMSAFLSMPVFAQTSEGFTWLHRETDKATIASIRKSMKLGPETSIHDVGVVGGFALVMTQSREPGMDATDPKRWSIYSFSLKTEKSQILVSGYRVKVLDWVGSSKTELPITYYDCWECEAATLFTTLHYTKGVGWSARWPNKTVDPNYPQPGAVVSYGDAGEPYDDDIVDQVFAVVSLSDGGFAAGSWFHSRDTKTGKISDDVEKYFFDPATGEDRVEKLNGSKSLAWRREICTPSKALIKAGIGQESKSCRKVLGTQTPRETIPK